MLLSTLVSLYTSRVVLQVLGVEDYGVYGVVGGIVGMFSFLNSAMAGATSRFLTFELGRGDKDRLKATFSSAMIVHIGIALVIFLLADSVGLWFLHHKLVIPDGRMDAANWVLQCSIISMFFTVTQVPYNATIISHEKMEVYAYVELLNVFLKLGIVYLLTIGNFDKLKLYAVLMLSISFVVALVYRVYCFRNYEESHFCRVLNRDNLKAILKFSGWELLGHMGFTFRTQGTIFVINMVFGAVVNAAGSLASTVQSVLLGFSNNILTAIRPQIVKSYANSNFNRMTSLIYSGIKLSSLLTLIITLPCLLCTDYIFDVWLVEVPNYCIDFCRILLLTNIVSSISQLVYVGIQTTGDLKISSLVRSSIYISTPFIIFVVFLINKNTPVFAYYVCLISQIVLSILDIIILSHRLHEFKISSVLCILLKISVASLICYCFCDRISDMFANNMVRLGLTVILSVILLSVSFFIMVFNYEERKLATKFVRNVISKLVHTR